MNRGKSNRKFRSRGAALTEYSAILLLVIISVPFALKSIGSNCSDIFNSASSAMYLTQLRSGEVALIYGTDVTNPGGELHGGGTTTSTPGDAKRGDTDFILCDDDCTDDQGDDQEGSSRPAR